MEFFNRDVETCCGCCTLRTGNIILGALNALGSGITVLALLLAAVEEDEETGNATYSFLVICLLLAFIVKLIFDVSFIYSAVKGLPRIIRAYYIMYLVFMGFWAVLALLSICLLSVIMLFTTTLHFAMEWYAFVVCRSYYRQLQTQEQV